MKTKKERGKTAIALDRADNRIKTFHALRQIFARYEPQLHANADTREKYFLQTKAASFNGRSLFFGAVLRGKEHVSFQLMPLYWDPSLAKGISASLEKHRRGRTSFDFSEPEPALFRELAKLTSRGFDLYRRKNLL